MHVERALTSLSSPDKLNRLTRFPNVKSKSVGEVTMGQHDNRQWGTGMLKLCVDDKTVTVTSQKGRGLVHICITGVGGWKNGT